MASAIMVNAHAALATVGTLVGLNFSLASIAVVFTDRVPVTQASALDATAMRDGKAPAARSEDCQASAGHLIILAAVMEYA
jgi:hypothetical protein